MFYIMNNIRRLAKWGIRGVDRPHRAICGQGSVATDRQALGVQNHDLAEVALTFQVTQSIGHVGKGKRRIDHGL